ncbi:MAG: AMP-binding protein, partial [Verrucomicrobiota bacterium]
MIWRIRHGREKLQAAPRFYADAAKDVKISDVATILYTSGTTGRPKGVVLTHEQIMSELDDVFSIINITTADVSLSFLPYSHIFGRVEAWGNIFSGFLLSFAESIEKIRANMIEIQPTFLIAVPRIFEKIYAAILAQVANNRIKREIFEKALTIGKRVSEKTQNQEPLGLTLTAEYFI